jgi:hypothetical protein
MDKFEKQKQQEEARKRNREIQAAFRERHRDRIDDVNIVHRILIRQKRYHGDDVEALATALRRLMGKDYVEELRIELAAPVVAGCTKKTATKVDRDAEIDALAGHVKQVSTGWLGKDKIRGALQVVVAGFGVGIFQVVKYYETTAASSEP